MPPSNLDDRCAKTGIPDGTFRGHRCRKPAKRDGWCTQHHPENVADRNKAAYDKWDAEWHAKERLREKATAIKNAEAAVVEEAVQLVSTGWVYSIDRLFALVDALKKAREA